MNANDFQPYNSDPDVLLMLEFQRGNRASFENLMRKYYKRIFNFSLRLLRNREAAEDSAQEVFIRVYQSVDNYEPKASFRTWIYTIAKNFVLNELKKKGRTAVSLDGSIPTEEGEMLHQLEDSNAVHPIERLALAERAQKVREAIDSLPPQQRIVVVFYRFERLSYEEIAETLGISVSAVKSLLSRARENLTRSGLGWCRIDAVDTGSGRSRVARFRGRVTRGRPDDGAW